MHNAVQENTDIAQWENGQLMWEETKYFFSCVSKEARENPVGGKIQILMK